MRSTTCTGGCCTETIVVWGTLSTAEVSSEYCGVCATAVQATRSPAAATDSLRTKIPAEAGVFVDHVEVHLPTERGITQYVEMLNFDSMSVRDYRAARVQWGWSISFNITGGDALYHADFAVSTATGETVLTLLTPDVTMRYVGWLWNKRVNDPKFRRLD